MAPFSVFVIRLDQNWFEEAGLVPVGLSGVSLQLQPHPLVSDLVAAVPLVVIPAVAA